MLIDPNDVDIVDHTNDDDDIVDFTTRMTRCVLQDLNLGTLISQYEGRCGQFRGNAAGWRVHVCRVLVRRYPTNPTSCGTLKAYGRSSGQVKTYWGTRALRAHHHQQESSSVPLNITRRQREMKLELQWLAPVQHVMQLCTRESDHLEQRRHKDL